MLIAFEGQDGAGKTSLLRATFNELTRRHVRAVTVDEFSDSPYGQRLLDAVAGDKFLRPVGNDPATVVTRALDIVADLYYFDQRVIAPALEAGYVVLKDRHLDTIFYTLIPTLVEAGTSRTESRALTWLSIMLSQLLYKPKVTVYVDAPLDVRLERIKGRTRHLEEDRARTVSREDLEVFAERERIARQLIAAESGRFITVNNGNVPLREGVEQILALVNSGKPQERGSTRG